MRRQKKESKTKETKNGGERSGVKKEDKKEKKGSFVNNLLRICSMYLHKRCMYKFAYPM